MKKWIAAFVVLGSLTAAPSAFAEATRTWVSGVGDDANPCSRTAPCKTWAGAISKTAAGGEINALDPGGFGALTITKSITINGRGTHASTLSSFTNGIIVNDTGTATPGTIVVNLRHLSINGAGTGLNGVRIIRGKLVRLEDVNIYGNTQRGITWEPTTGGKLFVNNSQIHDNVGRAISFQPGLSGGHVTVTNSILESSQAGVAVSGLSGTTAATLRNVVCSGNAKGLVGESGARINVESSSFVDNVMMGISGDTGAIIRVSNSLISGNGTGISALGGSAILSRLNNTLQDNSTDGAFTGMYSAS